MKKVMYVMVMVMLLGGCVEMPDGSLGLREDVGAKLDAVASIGESIAPIGVPLSTVWPPAALIAGIVGTAAAAWKGRKANTSHGVTEALVTGITNYRKEHPNDWEKLEAVLDKTVGEKFPTAHNMIRAIRKLPPKA